MRDAVSAILGEACRDERYALPDETSRLHASRGGPAGANGTGQF